MFKTIVFSAFGAALAVCLAVSALQFFTTEPLILHAEQFEAGAHDHAAASSDLFAGGATREFNLPLEGRSKLPSNAMAISGGGKSSAPMITPSRDSLARISTSPQGGGWTVSDATLVLVHDSGAAHAHDGEEWGPADGLERTLYTVLANFVIGFAVSLLLLGAMVLKGDPIDARRGLLWGIAGFAALSLLPALGLPPELPGTPAADIYARQTWWLAAAAASAGGIALLVFSRHWALMAAGVVLIVAPHVVGAPLPPSHDVTYPGALAGEFVIASLVVSALLWSLSGLAAGWLYERLSRSG